MTKPTLARRDRQARGPEGGAGRVRQQPGLDRRLESVRSRARSSLLFPQPSIDFVARGCSCLLWRTSKLGDSGFTVGVVRVVDMKGPFITAKAGTNEVLDVLVEHSTGSVFLWPPKGGVRRKSRGRGKQ